jgi:hypothetical protein
MRSRAVLSTKRLMSNGNTMSTPYVKDFLHDLDVRLSDLPEGQRGDLLLETLSALTDLMDLDQLVEYRTTLSALLSECPDALDIVDSTISLRRIDAARFPVGL